MFMLQFLFHLIVFIKDMSYCIIGLTVILPIFVFKHVVAVYAVGRLLVYSVENLHDILDKQPQSIIYIFHLTTPTMNRIDNSIGVLIVDVLVIVKLVH